MSMRAFSTLEILIALTLLTLTVTAVSLVTFGTPIMLANLDLEQQAQSLLHSELSGIQERSRSHGIASVVLASTTYKAISYSISSSFLPDDSAARITAYTTWIDLFGRRRQAVASTVIFDEPVGVCDPLVSTSWTNPEITHLWRVPGGAGALEASDITFVGGKLALSLRSSLNREEPTLLFFTPPEDSLTPTTQFDNASTSQTGYASIAHGDAYLYAANAFGSASTATCSQGGCEQVHIYAVESEAVERVSSISLATSSPPHALSSGGITSPASAIYYYRGHLYVGLQKTLSGQEFNIIDVRNPMRPLWMGAIAIRRSVNTILVRGDYAYVGTDDSAQELILINVADPANPARVGVWNAPGSTGFGLGTAVMVAGAQALFGRSYVNNADELVSLSLDTLETPFAHDSVNLGSFARPDSVRDIVGQDYLSFVLTTKAFRIFDHSDSSNIYEVGSIEFPTEMSASAMACKGSDVFVALHSTDGVWIAHITNQEI